MNLKREVRLAVSLATILKQTCGTIASSEGHHHQGKITPFQPGDPGIEINNEASKILRDGKLYKTQLYTGSSKRQLFVQDVKASPDAVWSRILDFNHYAKMVPKIASSSIYQRLPHPSGDGRETIHTRVQVGYLQLFIRHFFHPALHSLTWTLDYSRKSDLDGFCGYWYVIPHPEKTEEWSRVYSSVDLRIMSLHGIVPELIVDFMSNPSWVKKHSELVAIRHRTEGIDPSIPLKEKPRATQWLARFTSKSERLHVDRGATSEARADCLPKEVFEVQEQEPVIKEVKPPIGFKRYILVAAVLLMACYNVLLCCSS